MGETENPLSKSELKRLCTVNPLEMAEKLFIAIEALEDLTPNGWRNYQGEDACKAVLCMIELTAKEALGRIK